MGLGLADLKPMRPAELQQAVTDLEEQVRALQRKLHEMTAALAIATNDLTEEQRITGRLREKVAALEIETNTRPAEHVKELEHKEQRIKDLETHIETAEKAATKKKP